MSSTMHLQIDLSRSENATTVPLYLDSRMRAFRSYRCISAKYAEWTDPLTKLVKEVGDKIFGKLSAPGPFYVSFEDVEKFAHQLKHELLMDDLYRLPLEKPMLDRRWVWEKCDLEHYKALFGDDVPQSPFDLQPVEEKPHEFAKAMLLWAKFYSKPITPSLLPLASMTLTPLSSRLVVRDDRDGRLSHQTREPSTDPTANALVVIFYRNLARISCETQELIDTRKRADMETKLLAATRVESTSSRLTFETEAARSDATHNRKIETGLRDIESRNKADQDKFRQQVESREADLKFTKAELQKGEKTVNQQQATIQRLAQQTAQLHR